MKTHRIANHGLQLLQPSHNNNSVQLIPCPTHSIPCIQCITMECLPAVTSPLLENKIMMTSSNSFLFCTLVQFNELFQKRQSKTEDTELNFGRVFHLKTTKKCTNFQKKRSIFTYRTREPVPFSSRRESRADCTGRHLLCLHSMQCHL